MRLAARERPDLIVFESLSEAGAIVAGTLSIPRVLVSRSTMPAPETVVAELDGLSRA
ncbi:hypothetical protein [Paractinoplanes hotanensis]|uniref:Uncharacterized protein n=1 Tax=Paractinoplanes hotanensis TaxID=2906497 RepID=A0ABT0Y2Q0_9ACTN|nr:hypothetical protein [Actinoplanes hotanensis]MCM4080317.1 hypothetical protein [Actinoplanes hotanensis]